MTTQFSPELLQALQTVVHENYARQAGMVQGFLEVHIDPSIDGEYKLTVSYDPEGVRKFTLTTRYVPFGTLHSRFEAVMHNFFTQIYPRFVYNNNRYNASFHSIEVKGNVKRERKNYNKFEVTNLYGVKVRDRDTGTIVSYVEACDPTIKDSPKCLGDVRNKVIEFLYGEGK